MREWRRERACGSRTRARRRGAHEAARASSSRTTGSIRSGNAIVWDGERTALSRSRSAGRNRGARVSPCSRRGPRAAIASRSTSSRSSGSGSPRSGRPPLDVPVEVRPRIVERRLAVKVHGTVDVELEEALAAQEEPLVVDDAVAVAHLVAGAVPAPDWSRLLLDAHAEGYAAVGPAIAAGVARRSTASRRLGAGRRAEPALRGAAPLAVAPRRARADEHAGLPAYAAARRPLRRPSRRQTSVAIRSSERLKTRAPSASATPAATSV